MQTMQSTASSIFSSYASLMGLVMLIRTMANDIIPASLRDYLVSAIKHLFSGGPGPEKLTVVVEKQAGMYPNELYDAAEAYLGTKIDSKVNRIKVSKNAKQKRLNISIEKDQMLADTFRDVELTWKAVTIESENNNMREKNLLELSFNKEFMDIVLNEYLPNIIAVAKRMKDEDRGIKLFTKDCIYPGEGGHGGRGGSWKNIAFDHPATFDTIAMDTQLKKKIKQDLDNFLERREFYRRVGKAWKRGYLLYGPPGTGKSSLIAAMANHLKFDIYDIELTSIFSDSELKRILLSTTNRSIIVIEDIDCSGKMQNRSRPNSSPAVKDADQFSQLTLSGILNFVDGLWSSCGDERIIVFTTNHKDKIDPALLRSGRMDMHIHMSYCTYQSFKILASNYLGVGDDRRLFSDIDGLIKSAQVTPAEVAEELLRSEDPDVALGGVVSLLKRKKSEVEGVNDGQQRSMLQESAIEEAQVNEPSGACTDYAGEDIHGAQEIEI